MAKPNYQYEKRQKDIAKKAKQEEKRLRKLNKGAAEGESGAELPLSSMLLRTRPSRPTRRIGAAAAHIGNVLDHGSRPAAGTAFPAGRRPADSIPMPIAVERRSGYGCGDRSGDWQ